MVLLRIAVINIEKTEIGRGLVVSQAPVLSPLHVTPVGKDGLVEREIGIIVDGPKKGGFHHRPPRPVLPIGREQKAALPGSHHRQDGQRQVKHRNPGQAEEAVLARGIALQDHRELAG